jgi:3-dehydroquinate synthetase
MAEIIKHGLLADEVLLELAQDYRVNIDEIIPRAIQVKVAVVEADPYERSIRAHLNLGHTFAHAIEQVSGYTWLHGEAVGVGLIAATLLSAQLRLCSPNLIELVESLVEDVGLPTRIDDLDPEAIWAAMATDKKWSHGRSRFVLLEGIGQPKIVNDVRKGDVITVLEHIKDKDATQRRKDIRRLR